jgi:hypothetical protein
MKMCFGNSIGFRYADSITEKDIFSYSYGSFIIEVSDAIERKNLVSDLPRMQGYSDVPKKQQLSSLKMKSLN